MKTHYAKTKAVKRMAADTREPERKVKENHLYTIIIIPMADLLYFVLFMHSFIIPTCLESVCGGLCAS